MNLIELNRALHELRMGGMVATLETRLLQAQADAMAPIDLISTLVSDELACRSQRLLARRHKQAQFHDANKQLDNFDFQFNPKMNRSLVFDLAAAGWVGRREDSLLLGPPGAGKSHLLCALAHELIAQGRRMKYTSCAMLVQDLLVAKRDLRLSKEIKKLARHDGLIIDEMGYVQQSREEMEVLFTLLSERYERGSVLLTSNLPFSKWEGIFKDPMTTAAAIDRLVHHSVIVELNIPSYRMEEAKKNRAPEPESSQAA
jgi:DNA replication protein DnaC